MPRTTIRLDEDLLRRLKEAAAREGRTLQDLTNELLRRAMTDPEEPEEFSLELEGWTARERPGVDIRERDRLLDLMED